MTYHAVCMWCGTRWTADTQPRSCENAECEAGWLNIGCFADPADADRAEASATVAAATGTELTAVSGHWVLVPGFPMTDGKPDQSTIVVKLYDTRTGKAVAETELSILGGDDIAAISTVSRNVGQEV